MREIALPSHRFADPVRFLAAATFGLGTLYERRGEAFVRVPVHRRQHDPALEWHARQEGGRLVHLTLTFETLEEWSALADASPAETVGLYRHLLGCPEVRTEDLYWRADVYARGEEGHALAFAAGTYNPFNAWNTLRGAVHLTRPAPTFRCGIVPPTSGLLFLGEADVTADVLRPRRRDDRTGRVTRLEIEPPPGAFYDLDDLCLPGGEPLTAPGLARHLAPSGAGGVDHDAADRVAPTLPGSLIARAMLRRGTPGHAGRA